MFLGVWWSRLHMLTHLDTQIMRDNGAEENKKETNNWDMWLIEVTHGWSVILSCEHELHN